MHSRPLASPHMFGFILYFYERHTSSERFYYISLFSHQCVTLESIAASKIAVVLHRLGLLNFLLNYERLSC
jgi:hypothetical protein